MTQHTVTARPRAELATPGSAEEALYWLRDTLGTVARRDPRTRRLGPRRYRLELLAEVCDRDTFLLITSWLGSEAVPAVTSKQAYADDVCLWADVARELGGHERFHVGAITPGIIETWTKTQKAQGKAPRTINRRLSVLTALTQYAAWKTKETIASPVTKYDRPRVDPRDETTATPILEVPEFQAVVNAAQTPRQALVPVLIYTLAGRVTECCTAQLEHLKKTGGKRRLDLSRKGGKGRVWPLPNRLCDLIDVATAGRDSGTLLLTDDDRPMDRHAVDRLLNRLGEEAGVLPGRDLTPHVLRASKLTHMHDAGHPVEEIQEYADHAAIETTLRYIRRRDDAARKAKHAAAAAAVYDHLVDRFVNRGGI
ncbi:tyrosine-type recombinase/integrase [Streptomyces violaceorubidus]|uniref:tyrosine-type recombinase/integrase n=1 Tax=Streptomyces violaceorubidus TaxID=284042 RepID=UPI0004BF3AB2|nr:tyrosine-type recombinase/integrase [Streptomyces violaceorubidus]